MLIVRAFLACSGIAFLTSLAVAVCLDAPDPALTWLAFAAIINTVVLAGLIVWEGKNPWDRR